MTPTPDPQLPQTLDDPALGLPDGPLAEAVQIVLSHAVMDRVDRRGDAVVWRLGTILRLYATTDVPAAAGGEASPAPHPQLAELPQRRASVARRDIGWSWKEERADWQQRLEDAGALATWPVPVLAAYVRPEMWTVLATIITDGPELYARRMSRALHEEASRPVPASRRRAAGATVSPGVLVNLHQMMRVLVKHLPELARREPYAELLEPWRAGVIAPTLPGDRHRGGAPSAQKPVTDTSAPPLRLARLALARLDEEVRETLGCGPEDDELAAIAAAPQRLLRMRVEKLLRNRLLLGWYAAVGQRPGGVPYLSEACLDMARRSPHGRVGPAMLTYDPKTQTSAVWAWRPIPHELAGWAQAYMEFKHRRTPEMGGERGLVAVEHVPPPDAFPEGHPMRRQADPQARRAPALFRGPKTLLPTDASEVAAIFTGKDGRVALVQREGAEPGHGYHPTSFRHLARKGVASEAAARYCLLHGLDPNRREVLAETLLDHSLHADLRARYNDDASDAGRERNTDQAISINWALLRTDLGLRTHLDGDGLRAALRARDLARTEMERLEERYTRAGDDVPNSAFLRLLVLAREMTEHERVILGVESGSDRYLVQVPDDVPDSEIPTLDIAQIRSDHRNGRTEAQVQTIRRRRNWITGEELSQYVLAGAAKSSTVRGWMASALAGERAPRRAPWDPDDHPVFEWSGNRRALYADGLVLPHAEQRDALDALLATDPPEGWEHLQLMCPDPRRSAMSGRPAELRAVA